MLQHKSSSFSVKTLKTVLEMKSFQILSHLFNIKNVIACYSVFLIVGGTKSTEDIQPDNIMMFPEICDDKLSVNYDSTLDFNEKELPLIKKDHYKEFELIDDDESIEISWINEKTSTDYSQNMNYECKSEKDINLNSWKSWTIKPKAHPNSKCEQQVNKYFKDLESLQLWALLMWDASGKISPGLLSGNSNQLGDFDSCLAVVMTAFGNVKGKYCLADIDINASSSLLPDVRVAVSRIQSGSFIKSKHTDPGHFVPRFTTLHMGLCVPSSCMEDEVEDGLSDLLTTFMSKYRINVDVSVKPGMCVTTDREDHQLPLSTLVTLGFYGGILMLAIVSTLTYNNMSEAPKAIIKTRDQFLMSFSLSKNLKELLSECKDDLPSIHGIRSICTFLLFIAHKLIPIAMTPYSNRILLTQYSHSPFSSILRASNVYTDTFLHLSGVLAAYNLSKEMTRFGYIKWKQRIFARFLRLTPALLATVLFYAYVMEHLGSGPLWGSVVTKNADLCKGDFWKNILYIQNFFPFEEMCATHTHQLAIDMQLFLVAPLLVYLLHRWPQRTIIMLFALHFGIAALRYITVFNNNLSTYIYHNMALADLYKTANLTYSQAIHRATPYLMGIGTGYLLYTCKRKLNFSKVCTYGGWIVFTILGIVSMFYPSHLAARDAVYNPGEAARYAAISPITWSLALSWCIIACSTGHGGKVDKFLRQHWLTVISRLSYGIYLTQFIVFFLYVGSVRTSQEFSLLNAIGFYEVLAVMTASIVLTLLFDLPMQEIKNIIHTRKKNSIS